MLITILAITYILLTLTQRRFGAYNKEYTAGLIMLSLVLAISCFINSFYIAATIWGVLTLLEYNHFLKME